jgi:type IV pilus assembly protein PilB
VPDYCKLLNEKVYRVAARKGINIQEFDVSQERLLIDFLMESGQLDSQQANILLEEAVGHQAIDPTLISFAKSFLEHSKLLLPADVLRSEYVFPVKHEGNHVHMIMANPLDESSEAKLEALTGSRIKKYCCNRKSIVAALEQYFPVTDVVQTEDPEAVIELAANAINKSNNEKRNDIWECINNAHVIHLLKLFMGSTVHLGASDIHFEPQKDTFRVRARLDGVLHTMFQADAIVREGVIPRIKMISGMNLEIKNIPQDGRIDYHVVQGKEIDIRVSILPTIYGEKAVLRILDKGKNRLKLQDLAMDEGQKVLLLEAIHKPNGLLLVTGPTGSGKTSTLYAFLAELNKDAVNISTAEDPVEYELPGIIQVNCDDEKGTSFAAALRSFLRQDPDIIMVGEIRDLETADMAVKAALTGHLVFSTLHTNDAAGTITRIVNLGVPSFLLASCGLTVLAQRLIRTICPSCKEQFVPEDPVLNALNLAKDEMDFFHGTGCTVCSGTGYKGRMSVMEILTVNDEIERLILDKRPVSEIKRAAVANGMVTLRDDAVNKLSQGLTTPEEVLRVTLDT